MTLLLIFALEKISCLHFYHIAHSDLETKTAKTKGNVVLSLSLEEKLKRNWLSLSHLNINYLINSLGVD